MLCSKLKLAENPVNSRNSPQYHRKLVHHRRPLQRCILERTVTFACAVVSCVRREAPRSPFVTWAHGRYRCVRCRQVAALEWMAGD